MFEDLYLPPGIDPGQIVARLGLISDTHFSRRLRELPTAVFEVLRGVDLVLHAGDVGELSVFDQLGRIAPVIAVHGNDDSPESQRELPVQQLIAVAGQRILLHHGHSPDPDEERARRQDDVWAPKLARLAAAGRRVGASVVVSGHTHVPMTCLQDDVLLVNPGAIASPSSATRQIVQTVAVLYILKDIQPRVAHVDLAAPNRIFIPDIDWEAGFRAAHGRCSVSILDPDLAADWPRFEALARALAFEPWIQAVQRVAHRVWAGELAVITRADLIRELEREPTLPAEARRQLLARLNSLR
ncbi:MAG TPA: metallophosphoesterase [Chloroflexota bacterium]|nr:metallophosphoesterase [Chloroflexota bacterium]